MRTSVVGFHNLNTGHNYCPDCLPKLVGRQYEAITSIGVDPLGMSCDSCGNDLSPTSLIKVF